MYDQNDQQSQTVQPADNNPYGFGQAPTDNNSSPFGFNPPTQPLGPPPTSNDPNLSEETPLTSNPLPNQTDVSSPGSDDLLEIKQDALQKLNPLVQHLDQSPEEKFRTTMMMIQASDDQSLIKDAYQAAQKITDEKAKAQALLDVVNEINYFTQRNK